MTDVATTEPPIHHRYLPFTPSQLRARFARVSTDAQADRRAATTGVAAVADDRHVRYFVESAQRYASWEARMAAASDGVALRPSSHDVQVEKDERFWVVAGLMAAFHAPDRIAAFTALLTTALGPTPPVAGLATWEEALGAADDLELFFEANLPAPPSYKEALAGRLHQQVLVPAWRTVAARTATLEGATKVDALLVAKGTGFAVAFEAKVLSDVSTTVSYDAQRNQLARIIDVVLEDPATAERPVHEAALRVRRADRTCVVLLTPEIFREDPTTRLYGWLHDAYRKTPQVLGKHLPHRGDADWAEVSGRLGWLTWEDISRQLPGSLPWLDDASVVPDGV